MRKLFSRKPAAETPAVSALPSEVSAAIETSHVIIRSDAEKVLVAVMGFHPFTYSLENAAAFFQSAFSGLNSDQVARAVRFLAAHVAKRVAIHAQQHERVEGGPRWCDWRPLRIDS
ncbi:hypothetical protein GCM10009429_25980 [Dyella marensis]